MGPRNMNDTDETKEKAQLIRNLFAGGKLDEKKIKDVLTEDEILSFNVASNVELYDLIKITAGSMLDDRDADAVRNALGLDWTGEATASLNDRRVDLSNKWDISTRALQNREINGSLMLARQIEVMRKIRPDLAEGVDIHEMMGRLAQVQTRTGDLEHHRAVDEVVYRTVGAVVYENTKKPFFSLSYDLQGAVIARVVEKLGDIHEIPDDDEEAAKFLVDLVGIPEDGYFDDDETLYEVSAQAIGELARSSGRDEAETKKTIERVVSVFTKLFSLDDPPIRHEKFEETVSKQRDRMDALEARIVNAEQHLKVHEASNRYMIRALAQLTITLKRWEVEMPAGTQLLGNKSITDVSQVVNNRALKEDIYSAVIDIQNLISQMSVLEQGPPELLAVRDALRELAHERTSSTPEFDRLVGTAQAAIRTLAESHGQSIVTSAYRMGSYLETE